MVIVPASPLEEQSVARSHRITEEYEQDQVKPPRYTGLSSVHAVVVSSSAASSQWFKILHPPVQPERGARTENEGNDKI